MAFPRFALGADLSGPASGALRSRPAQVLRDLARNIAGGTRLALFLPAPSWQFRAGGVDLLLLLCLSFALGILDDYFYTLPDNTFNAYGVIYEACFLFLFFLGVGVVAGVEDAARRALPLAAALLAMSPVAAALSLLLFEGARRQDFVDPFTANDAALGLYIAWVLAVTCRAIARVLHVRLAGACLRTGVFGLLNIVPWFLVPPIPVWVANMAESDAEVPAEPYPDLETLLLEQPARVTRQAEHLLPQRPGVIDVYFIGVAGYADEDVFLNETRHAGRAFSERYDSRGRSLLLLNNPATLDEHPIASAHTVDWAIRRVAAVMDKEEDVLVLFFTSHGEEGAGLTLDLGFYPLQTLTPAQLQRSLDAAGVRWRAVIVSACFSGQFAEAMQGPATVVMTSARADRSSFGCGHDGDFTYFGRAFIGRELRGEGSIVDAFRRARAQVHELEQQEGRTPSEPQLSLGEDMAALLEQLAADLERRRQAEPAPAAGS